MTSSVLIARSSFCTLVALGTLAATSALAQPSAEEQLREAEQLIGAFTDAGGDSIPVELLQRARGIVIVPNLIRGGLILGARRGRGVLSVRLDDGSWSNPAFVALTGGSLGWQIGAETADIALVFANENAVRNIASGKFALGGEATAVAGPLRKQASSTMTFRAEVYGYQISRGLYAGAAFQGARLKIDRELGSRYYDGQLGAGALGHQSAATPIDARRFLSALERAAAVAAPIEAQGKDVSGFEPDAARTFPLPE